MILRPHWAQSAFPPGPDPGHKSPARPISFSHSFTLVSSVLPCLRSLPKWISFVFQKPLYVFLYCLQQYAMYSSSISRYSQNTWMCLNAGSKVRSFDRDIKSKLEIMSLEVDSACDGDTTLNVIWNQHAWDIELVWRRLCDFVVSLPPRRAHPHGRLCTRSIQNKEQDCSLLKKQIPSEADTGPQYYRKKKYQKKAYVKYKKIRFRIDPLLLWLWRFPSLFLAIHLAPSTRCYYLYSHLFRRPPQQLILATSFY